MNVDEAYLSLLDDVLTNGRQKGDRTGTGTIAAFGRSIRYSADPAAFPVLTTKKMFFRGVVEELLWFLRGETNIKPLVDAGVNIWVGNAYKRYLGIPVDDLPKGHRKSAQVPIYGGMFSGLEDGYKHFDEKEFVDRIKAGGDFAEIWGELGPVYGAKWKRFNGVDQVRDVVETLRRNPDSRRMVVSAWDPGEVPRMTLPPCHFAWQVQSEELTEDERESAYGVPASKDHYEARETPDLHPRRRLNLSFTMRSVDCLLGMPYDMVSYALLLNLLATEVNMMPGEVVGFFGDTHIYSNHVPFVREQLARDPRKHVYPGLLLTPGRSVLGDGGPIYSSTDIKLLGYEAYPNWKNVPLAT